MQMSILIVRALMKREREEERKSMQWTIDRRRRWKKRTGEREMRECRTRGRSSRRDKVKWHTGNSHFTPTLMTGWDNDERERCNTRWEWVRNSGSSKNIWLKEKRGRERKTKNTTGCGCKFKVNSLCEFKWIVNVTSHHGYTERCTVSFIANYNVTNKR